MKELVKELALAGVKGLICGAGAGVATFLVLTGFGCILSKFESKKVEAE